LPIRRSESVFIEGDRKAFGAGAKNLMSDVIVEVITTLTVNY